VKLSNELFLLHQLVASSRYSIGPSSADHDRCRFFIAGRHAVVLVHNRSACSSRTCAASSVREIQVLCHHTPRLSFCTTITVCFISLSTRTRGAEGERPVGPRAGGRNVSRACALFGGRAGRPRGNDRTVVPDLEPQVLAPTRKGTNIPHVLSSFASVLRLENDVVVKRASDNGALCEQVRNIHIGAGR
jgi:hypothetical protein